MSITIVELKDANIITILNETVQNLHYEKYPEYFKAYDYQAIRKAIEELLTQDNWYSYVAYDDNKPIGYILFYVKEYKENPFRYSYKGIHIDQLSVIKEYQNKGIGSLLMKKAEDKGKENNASQIELTYWENNTEAKEFYEKKGFEEGIHFIIKRK
jgi:ribosomal protein S18 acetylase RimI-like enzyme